MPPKLLSGTYKSAKNLLRVLWSNHPDYYWTQAVLYLLFILVVVFIGGRMMMSPVFNEGFKQSSAFSLELQEKSYDPFYAEIYDHIHPFPAATMKAVVKCVEAETQPTERATFLDVGCGTGGMVAFLQTRGYKAVGIDHSPAMTKEAMTTCGCSSSSAAESPETKAVIKTMDVLASARSFDYDDFSHIMCLGPTTIYEICSPASHQLCEEASVVGHRNLKTFLKYCHKWLRTGGHLVVQIEPVSTLSKSWVATAGGKPSSSYKFVKRVDHPDEFVTEVHFENVDYTLEMTPPVPTFSKSGSALEQDEYSTAIYNLTDRSVNNPFSNLVLEKKTDMPNAEMVVFKETFVNNSDGLVRQNEMHLTAPYSQPEDWITTIEKMGFSATKAVKLPDIPDEHNPQIFIFKKI